MQKGQNVRDTTLNARHVHRRTGERERERERERIPKGLTENIVRLSASEGQPLERPAKKFRWHFVRARYSRSRTILKFAREERGRGRKKTEWRRERERREERGRGDGV